MTLQFLDPTLSCVKCPLCVHPQSGCGGDVSGGGNDVEVLMCVMVVVCMVVVVVVE